MRVRIYLQCDKGSEERHLDYQSAYHHNQPSKVEVCTPGSFTVTVKELKQAIKVMEALDGIDEDC